MVIGIWEVGGEIVSQEALENGTVAGRMWGDGTAMVDADGRVSSIQHATHPSAKKASFIVSDGRFNGLLMCFTSAAGDGGKFIVGGGGIRGRGAGSARSSSLCFCLKFEVFHIDGMG